MREWTFCQFEWHRDNMSVYYRLRPYGLRRFFVHSGDCGQIFSPNSKINEKEKENETMKNKVLAGLLTVAMAAALATGCAGNSGGDSKDSGDQKSYTIGISQFAEHGSLDNCREGFLAGLAEAGIKEGENLTVELKNAAADMGTAGQISGSFVSDKVDKIGRAHV